MINSKNGSIRKGPSLKAGSVPSVGNLMLIAFWTCEGIIFIDFPPKSITTNVEYYSNFQITPWVFNLEVSPTYVQF